MIEEKITTYDKLIETLRCMLLNYVDRIIELENNSEKEISKLISLLENYKSSLKYVREYMPEKMLVVDGASACLSLEIGNIGIYATLGILFPSLKRIHDSKFCGIIPNVINNIGKYADNITFLRLLDLRREACIFKLAHEYLKKNNVDIVLIDGSLLPFTNLRHLEKHNEVLREYENYVTSLSKLHEYCLKKGVLLIGFVKRLRSKLLTNPSEDLTVQIPYNELTIIKETFLRTLHDVLLVDLFLNENEFFPKVPLIIQHSRYDSIKVSSVYLKTKRDNTPYRIDVAGSVFSNNTFSIDNFYKALGLIKYFMTSTGIPYPILKVDEEVKLSNRLVRELYDDIRYYYINKRKGRIISMKTSWGEYL